MFQVINNQYGMGTSVEQSNAEPELWRRAAAYRMHGERVDGNDVLAVREAAGRLLAQARDERKPALLETVTYRYRGHSVADAGKVYRTAEEMRSWRERDPITRFGLLLAERGIARRRPTSTRSGRTSPTRSRTPSTGRWRRRSRPARACTTTSTATRTPREQFSRMSAGAPYGERGEEQTWPT